MQQRGYRTRTKKYKKRYRTYRKYKNLQSDSYGLLVGIILLVLVIYLVNGSISKWSPSKNKEAGLQVNQPINYNMQCTWANIAKILAYTLVDIGELEEDTSDIWYNKYYTLLNRELELSQLQQETALQGVTYTELIMLLNEILGEQYNVGVSVESEDLEKNLTLNQFINSYKKTLQDAGREIVLEEKDLVILATPADTQNLKAWEVLTDQGVYRFEGLILDPLKGQTVRAIVKDKEILAVPLLLSQESLVTACKVIEVEEKCVSIEKEGIIVDYEIDDITGIEIGAICDLKIKEGKITNYTMRETPYSDQVTYTTDTTITLKKGGTFNYDALTLVSSVAGVNYNSVQDIPYGTQVTYKAEGDALKELNIRGESQSDNIRVVLSSPQGGYEQEKVKLISIFDYDIIYNNQLMELKAEEEWDSEEFAWQEGVSKVLFIPRNPESTMKVLTLNKSEGYPKYRGIIEITKNPEGYILVNEVDLEDYVAGVISSEMPTSYGLEATKVQAVAARTYAVASKKGDKYSSYNAEIDDTTASQVYNNILADEVSYAAVEATRGEILESDDRIISNKFFATSCGYTANFGEVWASGINFPSLTPDYLISKPQYEGQAVDLSDESEAAEFFKLMADDIDAFDEESPWFRWQVNLSDKELKALLTPSIKKLSENYPNLVKVLDSNNEWQSGIVEEIGNIHSLEVEERGAGGNIMVLLIRGDQATVKVSTEYIIRKLFEPNNSQGLEITRSNGSVVNSLSMLPSAFFTIDSEKEDGIIQSLTLYGGGFGHGVGMSQDGVLGMVNRGYDYTDVLLHYYDNSDIVNIY